MASGSFVLPTKSERMRRKRAWRYYCDHCNRGGASGGHMKVHEKRCCRNPERVCGMCREAEIGQKPIKDLIEALGDGLDDGVIKLRTLAVGCPACMLSAIIQSRLQEPADETGPGFHVPFDFNKAKDEFWSDVNAARMKEGFEF